MTDLPTGYRWATADETEAHMVAENPDMVVVPRTVDSSGTPYTEGEADLALPIDLPRNEDGEIETSAVHGECWMVHVQYSTDFDGRVIDPEHEEWAETFHGPFYSQQEAADWCNAWPDGDTDIHDMYVKCMNNVRPTGLPKITKTSVAYADGEAAAREDLNIRMGATA
jgi:hypothetical protein